MQSPLARSAIQAVLPNEAALVEIDVIARMEVELPPVNRTGSTPS